ncbi:MAG TPA: MFS transporter [Candidatus Angelobacter sp.]|jgi:MFS family permease|nr:MFS transporter [Candidatus Angelobacter sp.]
MASVPASTPTASIPVIEHPLRNPRYRLWLIGGTISFLGDQFYMLALPWLILQQTGSAVAMGAVMMAGSIPRALLMLMGGVLSDRMSARKIMMTTAMARTICVAVIGFLVWFGVLHMWELYVLAVVFGVADAFAYPASTAYLPSLLQPEQLVAASSVSQSTAQLTTIVGPVPAGFVIKALGIAWAFFVDAVSFLFIIGALWKLPDPPQSPAARKAVWPAIAEGIAYVGRDVPLRSLMLLAMTMNFCFTGPVSIGLTYLTKTRFGSPAILGTLISAVAAGSLLGALLAGVWKIRKRGILMLVVAAALAPCLGSIGLIGRVWPLAGVLFVIGALAALMNVHIGAWVMQRIDAAVRGRVASVLMLGSFGIMPISFAIAGFLVAWNLKFTFLLAGLAMLLTAAGASFQKPVREIE